MAKRIIILSLIIFSTAVASTTGYLFWRIQNRTPLQIVGQNILPNNDFTQNPNYSKIPDGWVPGSSGVEVRPDVRFDDGPSLQIQGINNYLRSPSVVAQEGVTYRVAFRVLSDSNKTKVRVFFHWKDTDNIEFLITKSTWMDVAVQKWTTVTFASVAPPTATDLAISIRPGSDDVIFVDDLSMGRD